MVRFGGTNVHIHPTVFRNDSRIFKITAALKASGLFDDVVAVGRWEPGLEQEEVQPSGVRLVRLPLSFSSKLRGPIARYVRTSEWLSRLPSALQTWDVTCLNVHGLPALPRAARFARRFGASLIYDTHELETESASCTGIRKPISKLIESRWIRHADEVFVVGEHINRWYRTQYGIDNVTTVRNIPDPASNVVAIGLRQRLGIPSDVRLFGYVGILARVRHTHTLMEVFARRPQDHLVFVGFGELEREVERAASETPNIHYVPALPPREVPAALAELDVSIILIDNVCLSYYFCAPNKLFESVAAGVPCLVSDFPELESVVVQGGAGWSIAPRAHELEGFLNRLTDEELKAKRSKMDEIKGQYRWQDEVDRMIAVYRNLAQRRSSK